MLETRHQGRHSSESEGETSATTEGDLQVNKRAHSHNATNELYFQSLGFINLGDVLHLALPASEWIQINKDLKTRPPRNWQVDVHSSRKEEATERPSANRRGPATHGMSLSLRKD